MMKLTHLRAGFLLSVFVGIALLISSCQSSGSVSLKLPFAPVSFGIDSDGNISIHGEASIVTPLGELSFGQDISQHLKAEAQPEAGKLVLIIRHKKNDSIVDSYYKISTGDQEVTVIADGKTIIQVTNRTVTIDTTEANIQSIEVRSANDTSNAGLTVPTAPPVTPVTSLPGLDIPQAADLITSYYDLKGVWAGQYLLKDIQGMVMTQANNNLASACVLYEYSYLFTPDVAQGTDSRVFSFQFDGSNWQVNAMGSSLSCSVNPAQSSTPPPPASPDPPDTQSAGQMIASFFDSKFPGQYVMQAVNNIAFRPAVGFYMGACVTYTIASASSPNVSAGTGARYFAFQYRGNSNWLVYAMSPYGC